MATLRLRVTPAAESIVRSGHPWVFAESIREQSRPGEAGELAVIFDRKDSFLAIGLYDPESPLRVRVLHSGKPQIINVKWWRTRLKESVGKRSGLFDQQTTGYRLINGESDGWPGFVLDRYDSTLVLKLYSVASLARLEEVAGVIESVLRPERLVLRLSRNIQSIAGNRFNMQDGQVLRGSALQESVVFLESGLQFEADVLRGQKTGFFLDQRENRRRVETLARGRRVLNTFSHTGGFSLYAARGGAASVTDLDLSKRALAGAKRNYTLNRSLPDVARCRHESICADAFEWLDQPAVEKFDMIILDPPSLAKRESERAGAIRAYGRLATSGVRLLGKAGVLVAASCSAHVKSEEFFDAVRGAVIGSRRPFKEIARTAHAADHPAAFAEGHYLKCLYLQFEP